MFLLFVDTSNGEQIGLQLSLLLIYGNAVMTMPPQHLMVNFTIMKCIELTDEREFCV